jgi:hypothetical protein
MSEEKEPKKKKAPTTIILGIILLAGIVIGVYEYLKYKNVVTTDDAQLSILTRLLPGFQTMLLPLTLRIMNM